MHVFSKMFAWLFSIRSHTVPRPRRRGTRLLHTVHGGDTTNQMAEHQVLCVFNDSSVNLEHPFVEIFTSGQGHSH
jgi:hypothetical protein